MSILKIKDSQGNWVGVPTVKGDTGNGISSAILNDDYTLTLTFTDGTTYTTPSIRGEKGEQGEPATDMDIHICSASEYDSETRIPTITSPDDKTFYLVPTEDGTSPDLFTEWVYVNNAWEMFGSMKIDLSGYVKDTDYATGAKAGVIKLNPNYGINVTDDGILYVNTAESKNTKMGTNNARPITPIIQHESTFYALAKVAGHDEKDSTLPVGQYTDEAKSSIQNMLGITDKYTPKEWIAESETELVTNAHSVGDLFYIGETLYKVIADLNAGDAVNVGVNVKEVNVNDILDDYATKEDVQDNISIVEKSASGAIVSFDDGMDDMPLKKLVVDINPVQDLHGYDSPWVGGGGTNKWDENWELGSLNSNTGLPVDSTTLIRSKDFCECLPSTEYAKVCSPTSYVNVFWYDENQAFISLSGGGGNNPYSVITSPSNAKYFKIRTESAYGTTYKNDIAINYPSTVTTYSPYENICPISGWTGCEVNTSKKNLCNAVQNNVLEYSSEYAHYTLTDGIVTTDGNALMGFIVPVKPSTTYTYSFSKTTGNSLQARVRLFSGYPESFSDNFISQPINTFFSATATSVSVTFTTTADTRYVMVGMYVTGASVAINNFQVEFGSSATDYAPYQGQTIPISWQTEAGTVYGGKLDVLSGELVIDRAMVDLGTLNWRSEDSEVSGLARVDVRNKGMFYYSAPICSKFRGVMPKGYTSVGESEICFSNSETFPLLRVRWSELSGKTNTEITAALTGVQLCYELAKPIEIQLTPAEVRSLLGVNNIFADTGDTSIEYFSQVDKDLIDYIETSLKPYAKEEKLNDYISDVQVDGTSIVTDGVANVPMASANKLGAVSVNGSYYGVSINPQDGGLYLSGATDSAIKDGNATYRVVFPSKQHQSVFYGLAKAAGHDEKDSTLPLGTYTDEAKTAIKQMLGVHDIIDSFVEEITGTDVTIIGQPSYRYNCGEVLSLSITPPSSGTIDIRFTSGSTPTVLTLPSTVKMPEWWVEVEANTIYEMCITDGIYCGVMTWAI